MDTFRPLPLLAAPVPGPWEAGTVQHRLGRARYSKMSRAYWSAGQ
jgi:hypothetical protein